VNFLTTQVHVLFTSAKVWVSDQIHILAQRQSCHICWRKERKGPRARWGVVV